MARFQFRMKTLLALRGVARDEHRAQLAEAYAAQRKLEERRNALEKEIVEQQQLFRSGVAPGTIDIDRLLTANRYEVVLRSETKVLVGHEQALAVEVERRRAALTAADREVRVLEKLRERQLEQFRQQQALVEMKEIDEVASRVTGCEEST